MFGDNPIRPPVSGDGSQLEVQSIFATLQGEGMYAGYPSVFIRLGGCNLACTFCDTEFENFNLLSLDTILEKVNELAGKTHRLIIITGGEPLRQPIELLCQQLIALDYRVQIETNGTLYRELPAEVDIVCSPKNTGQGYHPVRPDLAARLNAYKFILSATRAGYLHVPTIEKSTVPVYVQPMDELDAEKNRQNVEHAVALTQQYGYRLSLQLHKIIGVP